MSLFIIIYMIYHYSYHYRAQSSDLPRHEQLLLYSPSNQALVSFHPIQLHLFVSVLWCICYIVVHRADEYLTQLLVQCAMLQHPDKVFPANLWLEIQLHACLSSFRASCTCLPSSSNAFIVYTMRWSWYQCSWLYVTFPAKHAWTQALEQAPG